jgi:tetratricopeptide (TPR) repeat protein
MTDKKDVKKRIEELEGSSPMIIIPSHAECRTTGVQECSLDHRVTLGLEIGEHKEREISNAYYRKGVEYYNNASLDEAIGAFQKALSDDPEIVEAHLLLGDIYERKMKYTEAIKEYDHVLKLNPGDEHTKFKRDTAVKERARSLDNPAR